MLFAFTLSYDEFPRTLFTGGSDVTMPLAIYGTFAVEIHPNLFAFGVYLRYFRSPCWNIWNTTNKRFVVKG